MALIVQKFGGTSVGDADRIKNVARRVVQARAGGHDVVVVVVEDFVAGLAVAGEVTAVDQFEFEGAPEAFHGGVVVAVALAAHGGDQAGLSQGSPVITGGVLDAAVGMEQQFGRRAAMPQRHGQRPEHQRGVVAWAHGPTDDAPAVEVQDGG